MGSSQQTVSRYRFGAYEVDLAEGILLRGNTRVKLQDLPFRLLAMLLERHGEIVTREELRQRLWPENTYVEFDNSLGVAIRKVRDSLHDDAEAPRYVETIPRRGYRFLAPVTAVAPQVHEPGHEQPPALSRVTHRSLPLSRYWVFAGLVVLIVGAALYDLRTSPGHGSSTAEAGSLAASVHVRRSVAILGFRNLPGKREDAWLSTAFAEMLNTELSASNSLRLISGEDVARARRELPLADEDTLSRATLERLRNNPGADVVVLGSYTPLSGKQDHRIRFDIRLQDTAAGETIAEEAFTGSEDNLFELAAQAGARLRQTLGASPISDELVKSIRASLPSNQRAARLYADGRAALWKFAFDDARNLLEQAIAADPRYPLSHSALSEAWWHKGHLVKARAEAQLALDLSTLLPQEERILVEGQYRRAIGDHPGAVEAYQSLFRLFPDNLDYGLLLASAQIDVRSADARRTLDALRRLPPPMGNDARIDMVEASAWINTDLAKAREAAKRSIAKATAQGSHELVSRNYGILCQQDASTGTSDQALGECTDALQSSVAAGDRNGEAMMRNDLAAIYFGRGELKQSEEMFRDAIRAFREVGNPEGVGTSLSNWGAVSLTMGDLKQARTRMEESLVNFQEVEDKEGVALTLNNLAELARESGNLQVAETTYRQAQATAQEIDDKSAIAYVLNGLGDVFRDRGDLSASRNFYQQALALRNQTGEPQASAESSLALERIAVDENNAAEAEIAARRFEDQFHHEQQADDELAASALLIKAQLAQGKHSDAQREADRNQLLASKTQNRLVQLQFRLQSALVQIASGHPESARPTLDQLLVECRAHGLVGAEFDTRLALAGLEKESKHQDLADERFKALENSARSRGFGLIARKAASQSAL